MLTTQHHHPTRREFVAGAFAALSGVPLLEALEAFAGHLGTVSAASSTSTGRLLMVGDSLTVGSLPYQAAALTDVGWTDIAIDAHGSRGIKTKLSADPHTGLSAVDALRSAHGDADLWVVALGTNDAGQYPTSDYPVLIDSMLDRIGADHVTLWVNTYMPTRQRLQSAWNNALNEVASRRPDELVVYDWAGHASADDGWLGSDSIHYTSAGYKGRSVAVAAATVASQVVDGSQRTANDVPLITTWLPVTGFQPMQPVRVLDTRVGGSPLQAGERRAVDLSDVVPPTAAVVALNLTIVGADSAGFLTAGHVSNGPPLVSTVNFGAGETTAGHAMALLAHGANLDVYSSTRTDLVVDLFGWFAPEAPLGLAPPAPFRLIDTRSIASTQAAGSRLTLEVPSASDSVPRAAMLNVTAADSASDGFITVWPASEPMPAVSCLNFATGNPPTANVVHVGLDTHGRFSLFTSGQAAIIVDVIGTYDDRPESLRYQPVEPVRLLDTRTGTGGWLGATARNQTIDVPMPIPAAIGAGVLTVTAAHRQGWLSTHQGTSALNLSTTHPVSNVVVAEPGADRRLPLIQAGGGGAHIVFDLTGWFISTAP